MQLRLELAESSAPAVALWELVGEQQRQTAMTLLAVLIAQTPAPEVVTHLRPSDARELAFCLLELAELAEQRSEPSR